jgi:formylmethanofuran dehydrogenase subunit E
MTPIIRFVGRSGSGKTTLLTRVVPLLVREGLRVAVLKHAHHRVDLDRQGKDSFRFAEAGAELVTVVSPDKLATFEAPGVEPGLFALAARVSERADVILAEGFHGYPTPYVYVLGRGAVFDGHDEPGERLALVAAEPAAAGASALSRDDPEAIASRLLEWIRTGHHSESEVELALAEAAAFHGHVCPGQVLGVRLALLGCRAVGLPRPRGTKQLIVWVEMDRCGADAIQTVTGCRLGKRTLKFVDHGKLAATFLNTETGEAIRVVARAGSRELAARRYPALERYEAQMAAYRHLPDEALFDVQRVAIGLADDDRPGKPSVRVNCAVCGEEVNDRRHVETPDGPVCRACAGGAYVQVLEERVEVKPPWSPRSA